MGKGGDGGFLGKSGMEVMREPGSPSARQEWHVHSGVSQCTCSESGVQGGSAVTLNQNRRLPFERPEGRRTSGQINTR